MSARRSADVELLSAARRGDGSAFGEFYRPHRAVVLAFLGRRVPGPEIAADLLAETFAAALVVVLDRDRALPDEPVAWLIAIARNKWRDSARRGRVEREARQRFALEPLGFDDEDLRRIEELIDATDVASVLAELLPPDQLQAVQARIVDERDYSEIASRCAARRRSCASA